MSSGIFEQIGMGNTDPAYLFIGLLVLIVILLILLIIQSTKISNLKKRLEQFMQGKDGKSLEKEIARLFKDNTSLKEISDTNQQQIRSLYERMHFTYQKLGIVKYDAFKQMGGMLSFSLALLNEDNDGFIINSVHSSDGCYSYTKEIIKGECALDLGEEEKKALQIAMGKKS